MHSTQGFFVELVEIAHAPIETMKLIKYPESHDHSFPQIITVVVNVIDETEPHTGVEIVVRNTGHITGMYLHKRHDLFSIFFLKA